MNSFEPEIQEALFDYLLHLGDNRLVLGHRLSEWCGHGPVLEEDIALANIALDLVGQASHLLCLAGEVEGKGRSEDDLAYFREAIAFRNFHLVEQPRGDFAFTIARQFLFDAHSYLLYQKLQNSSYEAFAAIAAKALKEITYHLRHSHQWILRLGDGTEESHRRTQNALEDLWTYTDEMFLSESKDEVLVAQNIVPELSSFRGEWEKMVRDVLTEATLKVPEENQYMAKGCRQGRHSEHLGHLLAEMQILARSFPGAQW